MPPIPRLRSVSGPAVLSYGFRPFFLLGAIYAGLAMLVWLPMFYGELTVASSFVPRDWHVHEMIYGYAAAVLTGFLLTAIPNWTGRLPIQGGPLLVLLMLWLAGRIAVTMSARIGWLPTAVIDIAFLLAVAGAATREIVAGRNWGNLKVLVPLGVLVAGNVVFHVEAHVRGVADYGIRIAIGAIIAFILIIGGRIIPSFTRNWLARQSPGRLPRPFGKFDMASIALCACALALWIFAPFSTVTGAALTAGGIAQAIRLAGWAGERTFADRLVLILHVGYCFVPAGFILVGLGALGLIAPSAGIHAWTAGAVGTMTLAVMTRATLGHTGRALSASLSTQIIYLAIVAAAMARIIAALAAGPSEVLLCIAGICWVAAFFLFAATYGPMLLAARRPAAA